MSSISFLLEKKLSVQKKKTRGDTDDSATQHHYGTIRQCKKKTILKPWHSLNTDQKWQVKCVYPTHRLWCRQQPTAAPKPNTALLQQHSH